MEKLNIIFEKIITFCLSASVVMIIFIAYAELTYSPAIANTGEQKKIVQNSTAQNSVKKLPENNNSSNQQKPPSIKVEVTEAIREDFEVTINSVGTLKAFEAAQVKPEISGKVIDIPFTNGSYVKNTDLLFVLENSIQKAEFNKASASVSLLSNNIERYKKLLQSGASSKLQIEQTTAELDIARAEVELARAKLEKTYVRAPFEGMAGIRRVSVGDYVSPDDILVNIDQSNKLKLQFIIPEKYAGKLPLGSDVYFSTSKFPQLKLSAKVTSIDSRIDEKTRGVMIEAIYDNSEGQIYPGQFAEVNIIIGKNNSIFLPSQSIIPLRNKNYVFKVIGEKVERYEVTLGKRTVDKVEVLEGVLEGEIIVSTGHQKIRDGANIRISEPSIVELTYMNEEKPLEK
ncbi:MAG TPA: hypothetical protein DIV86_04260 [Alphaproteobacteria bacterium]|nr:hypothetical protein [Alphaproteobacteria bacterium]